MTRAISLPRSVLSIQRANDFSCFCLSHDKSKFAKIWKGMRNAMQHLQASGDQQAVPECELLTTFCLLLILVEEPAVQLALAHHLKGFLAVGCSTQTNLRHSNDLRTDKFRVMARRQQGRQQCCNLPFQSGAAMYTSAVRQKGRPVCQEGDGATPFKTDR